MLSLRKIAVTGGLASGKSTVCRILKGCGAYVVDSDKIVHQLLSSNTTLTQQVIDLLGTEIVVGNQIDRKQIAKIVFSNQKKLQRLEALLHPIVRREIEKQYEAVKNNAVYKFFVAEVPLLYEAKMEDFFDMVIAVTSDKPFAEKTHTQERIARQEHPEIKAKKADFILVNNGDLKALENATLKLVKQLEEK